MASPSETLLPGEFAELEKFSDWILESERDRYAKRLDSTMEKMQEFYDAAFPLLDAANKHLEQFPLQGGLPDKERNLLLLMMSLVLVSFPVEVWQQPRVPDSGAAYLDLVVEPTFLCGFRRGRCFLRGPCFLKGRRPPQA
ncbi:MAG TPA: hypothetical protein VGG75_33580 [Trebonia sp.]|jgi:hypothetical protein